MFKLIDIGIILLSSGIFLLFYMLFLRNEKYHQLNRYYLLFSLTFSSLLPFVRFSILEQPLMPNNQIILTTVTETSAIPFGKILYGIGALLFFILFLFKLVKVLRQILGKPFTEMNGLKVINQAGQKVPFSFFRYVVVDFAAFELEEFDLVLRHEAAHAKQWHTLDLLFVELVGVVCWFNPFVWAYKSALKSQHEFAADEAVVRSNVPRDTYFDLILKQVRRQNQLEPVHSFSAVALKSRIRMMVTTNKNRHSWMRYLSVFPLVILLVVGNSLLASSENVPSFMENVVIPAVVPQSFPDFSEITETVPTESVKAKRVVRQTNDCPTIKEEDFSQPNVLESQSWLSTQYGEPVEFYDEESASDQKIQYTVIIRGDEPQIYHVTKSKWEPYAEGHFDKAKYPYRISTPENP